MNAPSSLHVIKIPAHRTKERALLIHSGGLDSSVLFAQLRAWEYQVVPITFNYGQRHVREINAAYDVATHYNTPFRVIKLPHLGPSALTRVGIPVPEGHYEDASMKATVVPNRNMIMLSVAASIAVEIGASVVATAVHAGDHAIYPDCREEFIVAINNALKVGMGEQFVPVIAPFVRISKTDIVRLGAMLDVPFDLTWSCYQGGGAHCGKCGTCVERREAFREAGVDDPTTYLDEVPV